MAASHRHQLVVALHATASGVGSSQNVKLMCVLAAGLGKNVSDAILFR